MCGHTGRASVPLTEISRVRAQNSDPRGTRVPGPCTRGGENSGRGGDASGRDGNAISDPWPKMGEETTRRMAKQLGFGNKSLMAIFQLVNQAWNSFSPESKHSLAQGLL